MNVSCPTCQSVLDAPEHFVGKQVQCPKCKNVFVAQDPSNPRPAAPPSPAYNTLPASSYPPAAPPYDGSGAGQRSWERQEAAWERSWERDPYAPPPGFGPPGYGTPVYGQPGYGAPYGYRPPPPLNEAEGQRVAARAGSLLLSNGILTLITMLFLIIGAFLLPRPRGPDGEMTRICFVMGFFLLFFPSGLFSISGGTTLRRLNGKGLATTGVVFSYIMAAVLGIATLVVSIVILNAISGPFHNPEEAITLWCFSWVLILPCTIFNLIAAIVGTMALSNYHVSRCCERGPRGESAPA
jgi:hypothetical protein